MSQRFFVFLASFLLVLGSGFAFSSPFNLSLEFGIVLLLFIASVFSYLLVKKFGKSVFGVPFVYLFVGVLILGFIRLLFLLEEVGLLNVHEQTITIWWHLLFYLSISCFILSLKKVKVNSTAGSMVGLARFDYLVLGFIVFLAVCLMLTVQLLNNWLASWFMDTMGWQHFFAFAFAGVGAFYSFWVWYNRDFAGKIVSVFIPWMIVFLSLVSFIHLWELLTESWGLIVLNGGFIEFVESVIWLPSFAVLSLGFFKAYTVSNNFLEVSKKKKGRK